MRRYIVMGLVLSVICSGSLLFSATVAFRGGKVLAAQMSSRPPRISGMEKLETDKSIAQRCYAVVTVKPAPGRTVSIFDYSLDVLGREYNCVAMQKNYDSFEGGKVSSGPLEEGDRISLLYILDGTASGVDQVERYVLKAHAPGSYPDVTIPFVNCGQKTIKSAGNIPLSGLFDSKK